MFSVLLTLLGIAIVLAPFLLVSFFKKPQSGATVIFTALACLHVLVALITQALHIFTYEVVLSLHCIVAATALYTYVKNRTMAAYSLSDLLSGAGNLFSAKNISGTLFVGATVLLFVAFQANLRFNYSGVVDTSIGLREVMHSAYTYPLYSDEWVGSSLVQYGISEKTLPLANTLNNNAPFINFLMGSHSLFAEILLILNLDPLTQYVHLADVNALLIFLMLLAIQLRLGVHRVIAAFAAFGALMMTNSGNLPGIWYILPYSASFTFLACAMLGYLIKSRLVLFASTVLSLVLYPPMIVFALPFCIGVTFGPKWSKEVSFEANPKWHLTLLHVVGMLVLALGVVFLFALKYFSFEELYQRASDFIIRKSLDSGKVRFDVWNILPLYILPGIIFGIWKSVRERRLFLLYPLAAGCIFWIAYRFTSLVFIIEPSRVAMLTSMLMIAVSGIGMQEVYLFVKNKSALFGDAVTQSSLMLCLLLFLIFTAFMTSRSGLWNKTPMIVQGENTRRVFLPSPPVTRYIAEDDIDIFKVYKGKRFLSVPWKGLVIGVATKNIPLDSKSSTLTNALLRYDTFMNASCDDKLRLIQKYRIDLVYSSRIDCPKGFARLKMSKEGLILYAVSVPKD